MIVIKRSSTVLLILLVIHLGLPGIVFASSDTPKGITEHSPEVWTTPEEKIPVELVEKKTSKWVWIGLGALLLAGGAAAAAGGGGGDGGTESPAEATSGNVTVKW